MTTECSGRLFEFHPLGRREVRVGFDGGTITSDGGGLLLREVEKRTGIVAGFAACFRDHRKAEHLEKGANPRFVVTSLGREVWEARRLYEELYCARGEMENRIKEQLMLFADRTSTAFLRGNQIRLYFSSIAYLLLEALRRLGLKGTELAQAQATTIRLRVLKIGALIRVTVRKVWIALAGGYPYVELWARIWSQLQQLPVQG